MAIAQNAARQAWRGGALSVDDETRLLDLFGRTFTSTDHDMRMDARSEEHTSELQSLMRISYAVFFSKTTRQTQTAPHNQNHRTNQTLNTNIHHTQTLYRIPMRSHTESHTT